MMTTTDATGGLSVSFEFFPPKAGEAETTFWRTIAQARAGASLASSRSPMARAAPPATARWRPCARIARETSLKPAAHLTCVGASKDEVNAVIREFRDAGVRHIVALRGDPPGGVGTRFVPHPEGYRNAADLVRGIREIGDFEVSVSAYPERHPEVGLDRGRPGLHGRQGRPWRDARALAVLLPQCLLPAPARPHRGARHRHRAGARHPADHLLRAGAGICREMRRAYSARACPPLRGPRRGSRNPQSRRRHGGGRAGHAPCSARA